MFEKPHQPLASRRRFVLRMAWLALLGAIVDGLVLAAGAAGYHYLEGLDWLDAGVNSSLVMTGNGPIHPPHTAAGKVFAIIDALLGVILFAVVIGVLLTPVFHRMIHRFHRRNDGAALPEEI